MACAAFVEGGAVPEQDEIGARLSVDDLETVALQMPFEKTARIRFGLGEQERGRHASERTAGSYGALDVLSRETVTNDLQSAA